MSDATSRSSPEHTEAESRAAGAALRALPAVHRVVAALSDLSLPRPLVTAVVRRHLEELRTSLRTGDVDSANAPATEAQVITQLRAELQGRAAARLRPVINATGIVIHTNLGRSPLTDAAVNAVAAAARGYTNLEYDLSSGSRGRRAHYAGQCLAVLCETEAATVVNNCAAALLLILRHFASRRPRRHVVISRGELVQIGGGFRVPDILRASGARLREIGTTNRTSVDDYRRALEDGAAAMVLRVHRSNFFMDGFVASPTTGELAAIAREAGVPLVEDLGSGATFDTTTLGGGEREPMPAESLAAGADLVCFSGDKLLGGPQAGVIAGRAEHVAALKREPFFRALRCDKLVLAALEATAEALLDERADELPVRRMMSSPPQAMRFRAERIAEALCQAGLRVNVVDSAGRVGGGSLPRTVLPSVAVEIVFPGPQVLAATLRQDAAAVVGHVEGGAMKLDLLAVFPEQDDDLIAALLRATNDCGRHHA
jgi:L-seryl-tRNA(Ser) seleniumtransferase